MGALCLFRHQEETEYETNSNNVLSIDSNFWGMGYMDWGIWKIQYYLSYKLPRKVQLMTLLIQLIIIISHIHNT